MQFTTTLVAILSAAAAVSAIAVPVEVDASSPEIAALLANAPIEKISEVTVMLDREQCATACRGGTSAMKVFCRFVPNPIAKIACSAAAAALGTSTGQNICIDFCDRFF